MLFNGVSFCKFRDSVLKHKTATKPKRVKLVGLISWEVDALLKVEVVGEVVEHIDRDSQLGALAKHYAALAGEFTITIAEKPDGAVTAASLPTVAMLEQVLQLAQQCVKMTEAVADMKKNARCRR